MSETYDPRLLEIWRRVGGEKVEIECDDKNQATYLRHRLYQVRLSLKKNNHEVYSIAQNGKISIIDLPGGKAKVVVKLIDADFDKILDRAGIKNVDDDLPSL